MDFSVDRSLKFPHNRVVVKRDNKKESEMTKEALKCGACGNLVEMAGMKHCHSCLTKMFDVVKDPKDWKAPINVLMAPDAWALVAGLLAEAVEFFTATRASCSLVDTGYGYKLLVEADGYRKGPAA